MDDGFIGRGAFSTSAFTTYVGEKNENEIFGIT